MDEAMLAQYMQEAVNVSPNADTYDKFLENALEVEADAISTA
jgi:hypothetical protein